MLDDKLMKKKWISIKKKKDPRSKTIIISLIGILGALLGSGFSILPQIPEFTKLVKTVFFFLVISLIILIIIILFVDSIFLNRDLKKITYFRLRILILFYNWGDNGLSFNKIIRLYEEITENKEVLEEYKLKSNYLSSNLKKLVDWDYIESRNNIYLITEKGLNLISLIKDDPIFNSLFVINS